MSSTVRLADDEVDRLLNDGSTDANFADKFVGDEAVRQISDALASNCSKTRVLLDRNCVGADGAAALGDMLKVNSSIASLSLEWNNIGTCDEGLQRLADGLEVNRSLTALVLCNNHITAQGASCLARALRANNTLTDLDLRWNEVGNDGARAIRDSLDTNSSLTSVKLSGNKIDDHLQESIQAALSDRDSGNLVKTALWDDLHVSRGKAEQLEARLRRQALEEESHKRLDREREQKWKEDLVTVKQDSARHRLDFERQMGASAKQMAELEEQLIHERSRGSSLGNKLERESERREAIQGELDKTKQTLLETRRELTRQTERLQDALDSANEDRRVTQGELERVRDMFEDEVAGLKEELRAVTTEIDASRRAATRAKAEAEQATALHETARAEVRLTAERADEAVAAVARATRDGATALEETRRMYEERVEASQADRDARVKSAEERARAAEHERQRAEAVRQAASKELARLQVSVEERISQNEKRVVVEAQKQFDLELAELRERIDAVQKITESKEAQSREYLASLEDLRLRSTAELRDFGRELAAAGEELEKSRNSARNSEGKASKLQADLGVQQRVTEGLRQRLEEAERNKRQASELHSSNTSKLQAQHGSELKDMERRLSEARAACRAAEKTAKENEERVSALRQVHLHSLRLLESTVGQALGDAVASARQIGSGTGDLAFAGGE
ncbi:Hypothetical leucine rich repeat protein [Ectocarpus siliculosus]|uniref:Hypothetical leucine rich repeat protein n=1 Tax=Ectocarpus siliculosus TaxID=2880 RepID=D8LT62_ECTSI|nr:Hypothetical leucine rich repeat protein [Ectocarpus siliculosus]|eukprot:CBN77933.1 Hypothetical leucine rich repeat protein [Ectocarpus siliculosus]